MMRISKSADRQRGLTLFELLIVLALITLAAAMSYIGIRASSPKYAVKQAAETFVADVRKARLASDAENEAVVITVGDGEYAIPSIGVLQKLPSGVSMQVAGDVSEIILGAGYGLSGYDILFTKGKFSKVVAIAPITGKASLHE